MSDTRKNAYVVIRDRSKRAKIAKRSTVSDDVIYLVATCEPEVDVDALVAALNVGVGSVATGRRRTKAVSA